MLSAYCVSGMVLIIEHKSWWKEKQKNNEIVLLVTYYGSGVTDHFI